MTDELTLGFDLRTVPWFLMVPDTVEFDPNPGMNLNPEIRTPTLKSEPECDPLTSAVFPNDSKSDRKTSTARPPR